MVGEYLTERSATQPKSVENIQDLCLRRRHLLELDRSGSRSSDFAFGYTIAEFLSIWSYHATHQ